MNRTIIRDTGLLVSDNGAHDFDQLVGDIVGHQRLRFAGGDLAVEIAAKGGLMGALSFSLPLRLPGTMSYQKQVPNGARSVPQIGGVKFAPKNYHL